MEMKVRKRDFPTDLFTDWYWEQDAELRFTHFEGRMAEMSGQRPHEAVGQRRWDLPGISPVSCTWEEHRAALDARQPFRDFEYSRLQGDGELHYVSVSGDPMFDAAGRFAGYRGVSSDITQRKRAEEALRLAEHNYRSIFDNAVEGMYRMDGDGRVSMANLALARMLGFDTTEALLKGIRSVAHQVYLDPADRARYRALLAEKGIVSGFETRWRRADGAVIWVSISGRRLAGADGEPFYLGSAMDITERKREVRLLALEHRVARLLAEARPADEAILGVMEAVARSEGWECARYFAVDEKAERIRLRHTWHDGTPSMQAFTDGSREIAFRKGEGLTGEVWRSGELVWVPDVTRDPRVAMRALAVRAGVHGAIVMPVRMEGRVVGALSISSASIRQPDTRLSGTLELVCSQLGQFLQRKQAEEEQRASRQLLDNIVENIPSAVQLKSVRDGYRVVLWNKAAEAMYGLKREEATGRAVHDLWPKAAADAMHAADEALVRNGGMHDFPDRLAITRHRGAIHVHMRKVALLDAAGAVSHVLVVADDVSARLQAEERRTRHLRYQELLARFGESVLGRREASELFGDAQRTMREAFGEAAVEIKRAEDGTVEILTEAAAQGAEEARFPNGPEEARFLQAAASVLSAGLRRVESEARLAFLAQFDGLTGLPNRALLRDRFSQMIVQAQRHGSLLGVLFIDLDHFKHVNDTLGHSGGDALLREVARRLQAVVRPGDTVARISGDEFAVLLGDLARAEDAALVAQKILDALAAPVQIGGKEAFVSASIGIAAFPADGADAETLLRAADAAMYRAKQAGRSTYQYFTPEIEERTRARAQLGSDLRRALDRGEFHLAYQPKLDLRTGLPCGGEALLRWRRADGAVISPAQFVPVLEETGLIVPVGEWVLRRVCEDLRAWQAAGGAVVPIAVNLSTRQFRQQSLERDILGQLADAGVPPSLIQLEITESQLMHDPEHAQRVLRVLSDAGIQIAIDDFGTGYSSLSYLTRFPVSALKIDRSFVADVMRDPADAAIVRMIIDMAHTLGLGVVAEGVENEGQAAFLRGLGCEQAQGYLFARPMPAADFAALIAN